MIDTGKKASLAAVNQYIRHGHGQNTFIAERLTRELGGDWHGHYGTAPAPGHSKDDRSLSIRPHRHDPGDVIIHSFAGENWQEIKADPRSRGLLQGAARRSERAQIGDYLHRQNLKAARQASQEKAERQRLAQQCWGRARLADGTAVGTYLSSRGILMDRVPTTLRFLPANPPKYQHDAMVAAFGMPREPEPGVLQMTRVEGVHFTLLRAYGMGKAGTGRDKFMVGSSGGWPIVVAPAADGLAIVIGEGIETVLSVHQETGLGGWAAGSAGRLPLLADKVPASIECVTIAAEGDPAGWRGANELAERLEARGIEAALMEIPYA
jgi:hypothetical protein